MHFLTATYWWEVFFLHSYHCSFSHISPQQGKVVKFYTVKSLWLKYIFLNNLAYGIMKAVKLQINAMKSVIFQMFPFLSYFLSKIQIPSKLVVNNILVRYVSSGYSQNRYPEIANNMPKYKFSLIRIFPYKSRIEDSDFLRENAGNRFLHSER